MLKEKKKKTKNTFSRRRKCSITPCGVYFFLFMAVLSPAKDDVLGSASIFKEQYFVNGKSRYTFVGCIIVKSIEQIKTFRISYLSLPVEFIRSVRSSQRENTIVKLLKWATRKRSENEFGTTVRREKNRKKS